jgi:hypothetical protein
MITINNLENFNSSRNRMKNERERERGKNDDPPAAKFRMNEKSSLPRWEKETKTGSDTFHAFPASRERERSDEVSVAYQKLTSTQKYFNCSTINFIKSQLNFVQQQRI